MKKSVTYQFEYYEIMNAIRGMYDLQFPDSYDVWVDVTQDEKDRRLLSMTLKIVGKEEVDI